MNKKAFTLIELLIVVLIIGILAAIAVPQYEKSVEKAKFSKYIEWSRRLFHAEREYYLANGQYSGDFTAFTVDFPPEIKVTTSRVTFPDGNYYYYNPNNKSLFLDYKGVSVVLGLNSGSFDCYHYRNSTSLAKCKKISSSCVTNICHVANF